MRVEIKDMEVGLDYLQVEKASLKAKLEKCRREKHRLERILVNKFRGK